MKLLLKSFICFSLGCAAQETMTVIEENPPPPLIVPEKPEKMEEIKPIIPRKLQSITDFIGNRELTEIKALLNPALDIKETSLTFQRDGRPLSKKRAWRFIELVEEGLLIQVYPKFSYDGWMVFLLIKNEPAGLHGQALVLPFTDYGLKLEESIAISWGLVQLNHADFAPEKVLWGKLELGWGITSGDDIRSEELAGTFIGIIY